MRRNSIFSFVKGFFGRLFFILKGGVPWLDDNKKPNVIIQNSDSKNIFSDFGNQEQIYK